jgi:hypothetical protein
MKRAASQLKALCSVFGTSYARGADAFRASEVLVAFLCTQEAHSRPGNRTSGLLGHLLASTPVMVRRGRADSRKA